LAFLVIIISWIFSMFDASVIHPGNGEELPINNLLSGAGLQFILTSMLENFTGFAPLGLVLAMMLGIGLAEKVGLLDYAIRKTILKSPPALVTYTVVFVGIMGNLASDAAAVIILLLGALVFYTLGRHRLAGFAGAGAGFTANLFIAGTDVLLAGISTEAARLIDDTITITPVDNWYFNIISTFMLTIVGGLLTSRFVEPRLGKYEGESVEDDNEEELPNAKKGLIAAVIIGAVYWGVIIVVIFLPNSPLTNEEGGIIPSPFIDGIVPIILIFFMLIGIAFGIV